MAEKKDTDIRDVMAEEQSRGSRGRTDIRTARKNKRLRDEIALLFDAADERGFIAAGFIAALQRARIPEPQFSNALRLWRELQKTHSQTHETL